MAKTLSTATETLSPIAILAQSCDTLRHEQPDAGLVITTREKAALKLRLGDKKAGCFIAVRSFGTSNRVQATVFSASQGEANGNSLTLEAKALAAAAERLGRRLGAKQAVDVLSVTRELSNAHKLVLVS